MKFGKSVWLSRRVDIPNAIQATYEKPIEIVTRPNYFTIMQAVSRGYLELLKHGETAENTWTVIANGNAFDGKIKKGDVMWVDGETPIDSIEEENGYGASSNAIVTNVVETNRFLEINLKRNQNQIKT